MAKRITIKQYERIAEDHNKHNSGDNYTWEDIMYDEVLCGNNIKRDLDCMSKRETLEVIETAADHLINDFDKTWNTIYKTALTSLEERL
jgi:uncharacterized protein YecT (DUF1311 family)